MIAYFGLAFFLFMIPFGFGAWIWMKVKELDWFLGFNDWFWFFAGVGGAFASFQMMIELNIIG
ncbi:MAG: hypothetical protein AAGJ34_12690 [Pseudomonadota bacterium]